MSAAKVLRYTLVVRHPDTLDAVPLLAGSEVPDWATDLVHPDDLESGSSASASTGGEGGSEGGESSEYDGFTVAELKDEIDARNEGREDDSKLSKTGTKAELVAALVADDDAS